MPVEMVSSYTLHSMKATGLSWALQVGVDAVSRRVMGHHRAKDSGERMAGRYSRDDVLLRAARAVENSARHSTRMVPIDSPGSGWEDSCKRGRI